jgi:hypothetical protein
MLFNKENKGGAELRARLGFVDAGIHFESLQPWLAMSARGVLQITGPEVIQLAIGHYQSSAYESGGSAESSSLTSLVHSLQLSIALGAYRKASPSIDITHGTEGRRSDVKKEDRLGLVEQYKDEMTILNLYHESLDALIDFLQSSTGIIETTWRSTEQYRQLTELFIRSVGDFDRYFVIGSPRLFMILVPTMREIQECQLLPVIGLEQYRCLLDYVTTHEGDGSGSLRELLPLVCRTVALLSMASGLRRLPVELMPDGVVQTQIVGTIQEKQRADNSARREVSAALQSDGERALQQVSDWVVRQSVSPEISYVPRVHVHRKGISV